MRKLSFCLIATALAAIGWTDRADGAIVERVIAVVGERPILLSELRRRVQPDLMAMYATQNPNPGVGEETRVYRRVLDHMIDEQLIEQAAQKAHLAVNVDDIDKAIVKKAEELNMSREGLVAEAMREGLSEQDYRDEIRRQILEGKLVQLRVANRVRITESDARAFYETWIKQYQTQGPLELRVLAILIPDGATAQQIATADALAQSLVTRARNGEDFCQLIFQHSSHQPSRQTCGARIVPPKSLPPAVQTQLGGLSPGQFTSPIRFGVGEIDIIQYVGGAKPPTYEDVRNAMMTAAGDEAFQRERDLYLRALRRSVYLDVRLNG